MNRGPRWAMGLVVLLSVAVYGCKLDDITAEDFRSGNNDGAAGTLTVSMTTRHTDDGAIRFTMTGPFVTTPRAASPSHKVFTMQRSPQELDVVVVGDLESGAILILPVRDTEAAPEYQVTITEAADRTSELRADLSGYSTQVLRSAQ
jgi:hypothetical protein